MTPQIERPRPPRAMRSNVRWLFFGNVAHALAQWLQLGILARLGGAAAVGAYVFALALTGPVMMLANLQLRMLLATDTRLAYSFQVYRRLRIVATAAALAAVALIALASADARAAWPVLLPVCSLRAFEAFSEIYYGLWQRRERMAVVGQSLALNAASSVVFMAGAWLLGGDIPAAAAGAALGSLAGLGYAYARTSTDPEVRRDAAAPPTAESWGRVGRLAIEAAPLGVIILLVSLQQNVPRYFIQHYWGPSALGLFAAANQLTTAGGLVVGALGSAASPRLAALFGLGESRPFVTLTRKLALGGAVLGIAGVALSALVGRQVLMILFRPEFGEGAPVLVVLSAAAGFGFVATLYGYALTSVRSIVIQPMVLAVTLTLLVVTSAFLVPAHGAAGAAWAVVVSSVAHAIASAAALRHAHARRRRRDATGGLGVTRPEGAAASWTGTRAKVPGAD